MKNIIFPTIYYKDNNKLSINILIHRHHAPILHGEKTGTKTIAATTHGADDGLKPG